SMGEDINLNTARHQFGQRQKAGWPGNMNELLGTGFDPDEPNTHRNPRNLFSRNFSEAGNLHAIPFPGGTMFGNQYHHRGASPALEVVDEPGQIVQQRLDSPLVGRGTTPTIRGCLAIAIMQRDGVVQQGAWLVCRGLLLVVQPQAEGFVITPDG